MAKRVAKSASGGANAPAPPPAISGPGPRMVVLHGPDAFLHAEHTRQIREALETSLGAEGVQPVAYEGASAAIADVLDECRSFDLMARHKLVIVDNADKLVAGDNRAIMERYAASPSPGATLILRAEKWNKGKGLDALVERLGGFQSCEGPTEAEAIAWAVKRAQKRHNASLDRESARAIVERVGADLGRIDTEIAKLASAADGGAITTELVAELTGRSGEDELWAIQAPLLSDDPGAGLAAVRDAVTLWRQSATGALYAEIDLIRKAHAIARLTEQGENPFAAAKRARVWKDGDRLAAVARRAGGEALGALFAEASGLDAACKGLGLADADRAVETLALRFAMAGRRPSR